MYRRQNRPRRKSQLGLLFIGNARALLGGDRPALNLDFTTGVIDPRLTVSGGANGTRVNSAGVIVAATTPRFDYDSVTQKYELRIGEARTNKLLNSTIDGASLITQSVTMTAVAHTLTFYGTGTVTLSGVSTAGPLVGSGVYPARSTLTFTPTAGSLTLTVSGTVQFAQLEIGSFATSFIPTAGAAVARTADSVTMVDANFSSWYNQAMGTFVVEASTHGGAVSATKRAFSATNAGATDRMLVGLTATAGRALVQDDAAFQADMSIAATVANTTRMAFAYASNDFAFVVNGGTVSTDSVNTVPTVDRLYIGGDVGGFELNGHVRRLSYYPSRLPNATLQALTAQ